MRAFQAEETCAIQNSVNCKEVATGGAQASETGHHKVEGNCVFMSQWLMMRNTFKLHNYTETWLMYTNNDAKVVSKIIN